jgi:hypothetical protein
MSDALEPRESPAYDVLGAEPQPAWWRSPGAKRTGIAVSAATALALTIGGVALASGGSAKPSPAPSSGEGAPVGPAPFPDGPPGLAIGGGIGDLAPFGALHGEFTVAKPGGGYETLDMQRGTVTSVSSTALAVKSQDDFTKSYAVASSTIVDAGRDGITSLKNGHVVSVVAVVNGGTATVRSVADLTLLKKTFGRLLEGRPFGHFPMLHKFFRDHIRMRHMNGTSNPTNGAAFVS